MKFRNALSLIITIPCLASCLQSNERKVYLNYGENIIRTEIVKLGQEYTPPTNVDAEGYNFVAWYLNPAFSSIAKISSPITITEDVYLYAKYDVKKLIVTYECLGTEAYQDKFLVPIDYGQRAINIEPRFVGIDFKGWYEDKEFTTKYDFINSRITSNTTIYGLFGEPEP